MKHNIQGLLGVSAFGCYVYMCHYYQQCCNLINANQNNKHIIQTTDQLIHTW